MNYGVVCRLYLCNDIVAVVADVRLDTKTYTLVLVPANSFSFGLIFQMLCMRRSM